MKVIGLLLLLSLLAAPALASDDELLWYRVMECRPPECRYLWFESLEEAHEYYVQEKTANTLYFARLEEVRLAPLHEENVDLSPITHEVWYRITFERTFYSPLLRFFYLYFGFEDATRWTSDVRELPYYTFFYPLRERIMIRLQAFQLNKLLSIKVIEGNL